MDELLTMCQSGEERQAWSGLALSFRVRTWVKGDSSRVPGVTEDVRQCDCQTSLINY